MKPWWLTLAGLAVVAIGLARLAYVNRERSSRVRLALLAVVALGLAVALYEYGNPLGRWWGPLGALAVVFLGLIALAYVERASRNGVHLSALVAVLVAAVTAYGYIERPAPWWTVPALIASAALGLAVVAYRKIAQRWRAPIMHSPRTQWSLGIAAVVVAIVGIAFSAQRCPPRGPIVTTIGPCCLSTWETLFHIAPTHDTHPMCTWVKPSDW